MVLVRNRVSLSNSSGLSEEYIEDATEASDAYPDLWKYGPQMTRPARATRLLSSVQTPGLDVIEAAIEHGDDLAESAEAALGRKCRDLCTFWLIGTTQCCPSLPVY